MRATCYQRRLMANYYRIAGLPIRPAVLPGVVVPLCGRLADDRRKTPPPLLIPACWADFALAALAIMSDIMPLLRCQPMIRSACIRKHGDQLRRERPKSPE